MKVLLIDPPYSRFMNYYRYFYPVGLTYVAAALKSKGHRVVTYDSEHDPTLTTVKFREITSSMMATWRLWAIRTIRFGVKCKK
jgi:hypothetical protein